MSRSGNDTAIRPRRPKKKAAATPETILPVNPPEQAVALAQNLFLDFEHLVFHNRRTGLQIQLGEPIGSALKSMLQAMAEGQAVSVLRHPKYLTTFEAAGLLGVSRPHLIKLLDAGKIPYHRAGTHRRIHLSDLLRFKAEVDERSDVALTELTRLSQDYGLYR